MSLAAFKTPQLILPRLYLPGESRSSIVSEGLVLWLEGKDFLNSPPTSSLPDRSGNNNNATANAFAFTNLSGSDGNGSIAFDGVDDYLTIADSASIRLSDVFTVEALIKVTGGTNNFRIFFDKNYGIGKYPQFIISDNNKIDWRANHDTTYGVLSNNAITLNEWYHVVGTYDTNGGSNNSKLWVNGVYNNAETKTGAVTNDAQPLIIGKRSGGFPFPGLISLVRIYNRVLSDAELLRNYNISKR